MTTTAPPRPPESDELVALIEEARRHARRRRRRIWAALALLALAAAATYALVAETAGDQASAPERAPRSVASPSPVAAGRFWYTRTISSGRFMRPAGGTVDRHGYSIGRGPQVAFDVTTSVETWTGVGGTVRQRGVVLSERFASAADRRHWMEYHRPAPNFGADIDRDMLTVGDGMFPAGEPPDDPLGPQDIGDGAFSYRQLLSLPVQPVALRRRVDRAFAALGRRQSSTALHRCGSGCGTAPAEPGWERRDNLASGEIVEIAQMLSWPIRARLRLALVHAAMTLPRVSSDVTVDSRARDRLGRSGVVVTLTPPRSRGHFEPDPPMRLMFDRTGQVLVQPGFDAQGLVTVQGFVGSVYRVPRGVSPIPIHDGLVAPPAVSVLPAVGKPATVFRVKVTGGATATTSSRAPRLGGMVSGPVFPGCSSGFRKPTPPVNPTNALVPGQHGKGVGSAGIHLRSRPPGRHRACLVSRPISAPGLSSVPGGAGADWSWNLGLLPSEVDRGV